MNFKRNVLGLALVGAVGLSTGFIGASLNKPERDTLIERRENDYDDSALRDELRDLRNELSRVKATSESNLESRASVENYVNGGSNRPSAEEDVQAREYVLTERMKIDFKDEARRQAQIYAKAGILSQKRNFNLEAAALLYSQLSDAEVEKMTGAVETVSHFGDRIGLSPEAQADITSNLHNQRASYFASQEITQDGLRDLARTNPNRFTDLIRGYRVAEAQHIANWFLTNNRYVTSDQANRAVSYFSGIGAQHVEQGIAGEVQRLTAEASGRSWSFNW